MKAWILALFALLVLLPVHVNAGKNIRKNITVTLFKSSKNITKPNIVAPGGMEVNTFTGNLFHQREDVYIPALGLPLEVVFAYNSGLSKNNWGMGNGWTSTFNMMYEVTPGHIIIRGPDGSKDSFTVSGGTYTAPTGVFSTLTEYAPGKFDWRQTSGVNVRFDDASHKRITSIEDRNGNIVTFADFVGGQPTRMTDANGRSIRLNWSAGRLVSLVDSIASPPRTTSYQYDTRGNLKKVTYPLGDIYRYQYDARNRMTGFIDELGHPVSIANGSGGGVSSVSTPGDATTPPTSISIVFNTGIGKTDVSSTVFGAVQTTSYSFDSQKRLIQIQGPLGLDEHFTYDTQNNITSYTNSLGQTYTCVWNSSGDLLSVIDPLAQTESWTYEPVNHQVTSYTDKKGNVTGFLVDAFSNPIEVSRPLGITESFTYDPHGYPVSVTDGRGNTTTFSYTSNGYLSSIIRPIGSESFTYDNSGNVTSFTDADGRTTVYSHDALDRTISRTNALGGNTLYLYGGMENLVQVTDENGHSTTYGHDALHRVISIARPEGITVVARDEYGNIRTSTDFNGNITSYNYDARNRVTDVTNPLGSSATLSYDSHGNVVGVTDFNGNPTGYLHDGLNRLILRTNALGHTSSMTYDPNDNVVSMTDENGHVTGYTVDALDRITQITHPIGTETFTYDNNSNVTSATDPLGHTTLYTHDAMDRPVTILDPLLHSSSLVWSSAGDLLSSTDPNGLTRSAAYDGLHRMVSRTNPMLEVTTFAYDAVGNVVSVSTPYGNTFSYLHDASDRLISVSDAMGPIQSCTYDANSNRITSTDALGNTKQYLYDVMNRPVTITAPLGQTVSYAYDNNSNTISTTDGEGGVTTFGYDAMNRRMSETFPGGLTTSLGFDPAGNVVSILDARGNPTTMLYDAMDRAIKTTFADGTFKVLLRDAAGNVTSQTDQGGVTTSLSYDGMNRMISRSHPGGNDVYAYDDGGRLIGASNAVSTIAMTYDGADRLLSEVLNGKTTSHTYNVAGRTIVTANPSTLTFTSTMDLRLQPLTVATGGTPIVTYAYDLASRMVSQTNGNGTSSTYGYDDNGQMTSVSHLYNSGASADFICSFDDRGFQSSVEKPHRPLTSEKYLYDATTRLTGYKQGDLVAGDIPVPVTQSQFTFDQVGNRTLYDKDGAITSYTSNTINAYASITSSVPISPSYDANGNMTSDGFTAYTYDFENRMTGASNLVMNAAYLYDPFGRKIQKTVNGTVTKYFFDGGDVIEERDGSDAVTGGTILGSKAEVTTVLGGGGTLESYYMHRNPMGDLISITNTAGNVVEEYAYSAFGEPSFFDSAYTQIPVSAHNVNPFYQGNELAGENPLYEGKDNRYYNPQLGRYMQQDASSLMGSAPDLRNGYSNAGNNPTNYSSGTPKKLISSKFVVRELADPGVHLVSYSKPPIRRLKIKSADPQFLVGYGSTMAYDDWISNSPSASALPGSPIKGISIKGGRNPGGNIGATDFATPGNPGLINPHPGFWSPDEFSSATTKPVTKSSSNIQNNLVIGGGLGGRSFGKTTGEDDWHRNSPSASARPGNPIKGISLAGGVGGGIGATPLTIPFTDGGTMADDSWHTATDARAIPRTNVPIREFVTLIALGVAPPKHEYIVQYTESDWGFLSARTKSRSNIQNNRVMSLNNLTVIHKPVDLAPVRPLGGVQAMHWVLEVRPLRIEMK